MVLFSSADCEEIENENTPALDFAEMIDQSGVPGYTEQWVLVLSVTRGNPSLEEKRSIFPYFSSSDGFPRVTDIADRTGRITYVTHGKMIYCAHARQSERPLAWRGGRQETRCCQGKLSRERVLLVVWWAREARECPPSI